MKKRMKTKRFLSMLLSVMMVFSLFTGTVSAAELSAVEPEAVVQELSAESGQEEQAETTAEDQEEVLEADAKDNAADPEEEETSQEEAAEEETGMEDTVKEETVPDEQEEENISAVPEESSDTENLGSEDNALLDEEKEQLEIFQEEIPETSEEELLPIEETAEDEGQNALATDDEILPDDGEQKPYLSDIRVKLPGSKSYTSIYKEGEYEYDCVVPANVSSPMSIGATLSADAPQNSEITLSYYHYIMKKDYSKKISSTSTGGSAVSSIVTKGIETVSASMTVGTEDDTQVYRINFLRSPVINSAVFAQEDGTVLASVNGVYYLPEGESPSLTVTVNAYCADLTVNGASTESDSAYTFVPEFDETGKFLVTVVASCNGEQVTEVYEVKRLAAGEAITGSCGENVAWSLLDGELTISGTGAMDDWSYGKKPTWNIFADSIKSVIIEDGVTSIGNNTFQNYTALERAEVAESVTSVGNYAFQNCTSLDTVTIGTLGNYIFENCTALTNVTLHTTLEKISECAFRGCTSLESIKIPEGSTEIAPYAFENCTALKSVSIPGTMTGLSGYPFENCPALQDIIVKGSQYMVKDDIVYSADGGTLVLCPPAYEGEIVIPDGVTSVNDAAFFYCEKLTGVTMPDGLVSIGEDAFNHCKSVKKIWMPDSVTEIKASAFQECSELEEVKLSVNLTALSDYMFWRCEKLPKIEIPEKITSIGKSALRDCNTLNNIVIPESVTSLGDAAIYGCRSLTHIELPSGITELPDSLFGYCLALTEIEIPDGVKTLPSGLFSSCSALERVTIPASVEEIARTAFSGTKNSLKYVFFKGTHEQWAAITGDKPEPPSWSTIIVFGSSIGSPENAPLIVEQPTDQVFSQNADAENALKLKIEEPEEGASYYFSWYSNEEKTRDGAVKIAESDAEGNVYSYYSPATDIVGNRYYYCIVMKVDAQGAATWTYSDIATVAVSMNSFSGNGTEEEPYRLENIDDLNRLNTMVADGESMAGMYFRLMDDITLPSDWKPIGVTIDGSNNIESGKNLHAFSGILDGGGKTITVSPDGLPLLGYVQNAEVRNLNIYGERIAGYGLVNNFEGVGLSGSAVVIDHVTLKSGSSTLKSGLIGANITTNGFAGCSAGYVATIRNCTIEKGVTVGYDGTERMIGSIAGRMQGTVENCVSYATVKGIEYVGGIIGTRDNAMGNCIINGCKFYGTVEAGGTHAGGIAGGGYSNYTAPNGIRISINNCYSGGTITGTDKVGGILGGDTFVAQAWNQYSFKGNSFAGKVKATEGTYVGGVIGFYDSLNMYDDISDNTYISTCGAEKGIGYVQYVDTSAANHETESGAVYFNTAVGTSDCPPVEWCNWQMNHNRTDDPLGKDASVLTHSSDSVEDPGSVVAGLSISGTYKTEYYLGEALDFTGMIVTVNWSDGTTTTPALSEIKVTGYDANTRGEQTLTLSYENVSTEIQVIVRKPGSAAITVKFTLLGDSKHGSSAAAGVHTLADGNLDVWVAEKEYQIDSNANVKELLDLVLAENNMTCANPSGNYVESITRNGVTVGEFTNGTYSGWMYTLNGVHVLLGVSEQYLEDGDEVVFHYTDDYRKESWEHSEDPVKPVDPTTPSEPTKPTEPTKPAEPEKPAVGSIHQVSKVQYKIMSAGKAAVAKLTDKTVKNITVPATVKIGGETFTVTTIGSQAFKGCTKLQTITLGKNITMIGSEAFSGCTALTKVKGASALTSINKKAFYNCKKLQTIGSKSGTITLSKVKTIGSSAFYGCKAVKKVNASSAALTKIDASAFAKCTALTAFTASSKKLATIGKQAFYGDKKLASVTLKTEKLKKSKVGSNAFKGIKSTCKFKVPSKKISSYKSILKARGAGSKIKVTK